MGRAASVTRAVALLDKALPDAVVFDINVKGDYVIGVARGTVGQTSFMIVTG